MAQRECIGITVEFCQAGRVFLFNALNQLQPNSAFQFLTFGHTNGIKWPYPVESTLIRQIFTIFWMPRKKLRAAMKSMTRSWERDLKEQEAAESLGGHWETQVVGGSRGIGEDTDHQFPPMGSLKSGDVWEPQLWTSALGSLKKDLAERI